LKHYVDRKVAADAPAHAAGLPEAARVEIGKSLFRYHCSPCHAEWGYNGIVPILQPWTPELIRETVRNLHRANPAMPPWMGNESERAALAVYLAQMSQGRP
jgi:mono/diheme cytochrome c family protein